MQEIWFLPTLDKITAISIPMGLSEEEIQKQISNKFCISPNDCSNMIICVATKNYRKCIME